MELLDQFSEFHFLRPAWLYAMIAAALLYFILRARESNRSNWENSIDTDLLPYLLVKSNNAVKRNPFALLLAAWLVAMVSLAGPVWEKTPQPMHAKEDVLVVLLDLSISMYVTDLNPNRLIRARRKLLDILQSRQEGVTGLIVYAGDAHAVSPLTQDTATIASMLPALVPEIMPLLGSNLESALVLALEMFHNGGAASGRILIITDEITDVASSQLIAEANRDSFPVSILGVGTAEGSPISLDFIRKRAGFLKNNQGVIVIPKLDRQALSSFAAAAGGRYAETSLMDTDIDYLLAESASFEGTEFVQIERNFDDWYEQGPWLLLLLLPLAAVGFRRGWVWVLLLYIGLPAEPLYALDWQDFWQTPDQRGAQSMQAGDLGRAAELFDDPSWKGTAYYQNGDYAEATDAFTSIQSSDGQYNRGNALAKLKQFQNAIKAYEKAIAMNPDNTDAIFNKELLEKMLQQQNQGEQGQNDQQQTDQQQDNQDNRQAENEQQPSQQEQRSDRSDEEQAEPEPEQEAQQLAENQMAEEEQHEMDKEEEQALQQWLRQIPDHPGGLLKNKFQLQYQLAKQRGEIPKTSQVW